MHYTFAFNFSPLTADRAPGLRWGHSPRLPIISSPSHASHDPTYATPLPGSYLYRKRRKATDNYERQPQWAQKCKLSQIYKCIAVDRDFIRYCMNSTPSGLSIPQLL